VTLTFVLWLAATVVHFAVAAAAARRLSPDDTLDELIFVAVVGGVAGLSFVLHATALSAGLSLGFGLAGLAVWNTFVWAVVRRVSARETVQQRPDFFELLVLAILSSVVLAWMGASATSLDLHGPDAAHYHVPYAVNLAHGDGLFALPATPHLYPMAGSLVAAWFIIPFGNTLLVDLAMLLPFGLMVAAINLQFRAMTGESGLRWSTWLSLALFSTPLFRSASAGAADLWFAAAFVAVVALVTSAWARRSWRAIDAILLGGAAGLLLGSKTTGIASLGLLGAGAVGVWVLRRVAGARPMERPSLGITPVLGALILALGAGGVWLVRNWILFGSPLAPAGLDVFSLSLFRGETHQRTTYYSVLGEMERPGFDLIAVATRYIRQWLGPAFLPTIALIAFTAGDLVLTLGRRTTDPRWWARMGALLLTVFSGGVLIWMLIGAPWTALLRSNGLTLRYALPLAALGPLLGYAALFPLSVSWTRNRVAAAVASGSLMFTSLWWFWKSSMAAPPQSILPAFDLVWLVVAGAIVLLMLRTRAKPMKGLRGAAVVATMAVIQGYQISEANVAAHRDTEAKFEAEELAYAAGTPRPQPDPQPGRAAFLAVRSDEKARGRSCAARRFYFLVRYDQPLEFQPPALSSRSYYAGRDVEPARRAGPIGDCDYIVTSPALQGTEKGQALVSALAGGAATETVPSPAEFVVLRPAK